MGMLRHLDTFRDAADHLGELADHPHGEPLGDVGRDSQDHGDRLSQAIRACKAESPSGDMQPEGSEVVKAAAEHLWDVASHWRQGEDWSRQHKAASAHHGGALRELVDSLGGGDDDQDDDQGGGDYMTAGCRCHGGKGWAEVDYALGRLGRRVARLLGPRVVRLAGGRGVQENAGAVQSVDTKNRSATFVMSTEEGGPDRQGDIVSVAGIDLSNFLRSPVALFNHDANAVVGRWVNVRKAGKRLIGTLVFAANRAGEEAWQLVKSGVLAACSVGFNPTARPETIPATGGMYFPSVELFECSLVSIPANANALLVGRAAPRYRYR